MDAEITLQVNGESHRLTVDRRTSLLNALRERLGTWTTMLQIAPDAPAAPGRCTRTASGLRPSSSTPCTTPPGSGSCP
jgi:aerobic-type carbon monoxide dehydrogenase small subunit (CoxS/CutS family)